MEEKTVAWCGQTNETNCKGHYTRHYGITVLTVRMASDLAHADDGVMSDMGISK